MAKEFNLQILAPDENLFSGMAESVSVTGVNGRFTILAGHAPMVAALEIGELEIKCNGEKKYAYHSNGFVEAGNDKTIIFIEACEWAEDIDIARAETAKERSIRHLKRYHGDMEHKHYSVSLMRAVTRLNIANRYKK